MRTKNTSVFTGQYVRSARSYTTVSRPDADLPPRRVRRRRPTHREPDRARDPLTAARVFACSSLGRRLVSASKRCATEYRVPYSHPIPPSFAPRTHHIMAPHHGVFRRADRAFLFDFLSLSLSLIRSVGQTRTLATLHRSGQEQPRRPSRGCMSSRRPRR
jgi:hypothetical protein